MANKGFKSFDAMFAHLQKEANKVLKNEIAETVVKTMQEHIQSDVYDVYDPQDPSKRRMYNDGLIDPRNIEIEVVRDNTISVEDIAYDGYRNVPYIVESGEGYFEGASPILTQGRKFTEGTREELKKSDKLNIAMKKGLKKSGLDVR